MGHDLVAVGIESDHSVAGADNLDAFDFDDFTSAERGGCGVHVDGEWPSVFEEHAEDVFLDCKARVDVADREDWSVGIAVVAEVRVATEGEVLGEDGRIGVLFFPCLLYTSPSPRDLSTSRMPSSA